MSNTLKQTAHEYIASIRVTHLAIVREDGAPTIRPIGSFAPVAPGALDLYFTAPLGSAKARALLAHPRASFFFQADGQPLAAFKGASLIGDATVVAPADAEYPQAVAALTARSPYFKERVEKGELANVTIFRFTVVEARYSDFAQQRGIQDITL
jgi:hypothetical protein